MFPGTILEVEGCHIIKEVAAQKEPKNSHCVKLCVAPNS